MDCFLFPNKQHSRESFDSPATHSHNTGLAMTINEHLVLVLLPLHVLLEGGEKVTPVESPGLRDPVC